jgi:ABC-2 type transport system permease protein
VRELNAVATIAFRDVMKFVRDPFRVFATFIFPVVIIAGLGGSLQANLGTRLNFNFLSFTYTGVFAMTLFQSSAFGIISLIEDRANDFTQEIFISPISRYSIIFGKIAGESTVAVIQGIGITLFAAIIGVAMTPAAVLSLVPAGLACCLLGGTFGIICLANISTQRAANQIFPFLFLPQYFLGGVFNPIRKLPPYLEVLSRISPLRYAVDFTRNLFFFGSPISRRVVLDPVAVDGAVIAGMFLVFLVIGTSMFVRRESNR